MENKLREVMPVEATDGDPEIVTAKDTIDHEIKCETTVTQEVKLETQQHTINPNT